MTHGHRILAEPLATQTWIGAMDTGDDWPTETQAIRGVLTRREDAQTIVDR